MVAAEGGTVVVIVRVAAMLAVQTGVEAGVEFGRDASEWFRCATGSEANDARRRW